MSKIERRLFFLESLELLSSYLFSRSVELEAVGTRGAHEEGGTELKQFLQEIEARHAIACGQKLKGVLRRVEQSTSNIPYSVREESRGVVRGRLDVPRYVSQRGRRRSWPRTYPVIRSEVRPQTPENALVVEALHGLSRQLGRNVFSEESKAASRQASALYDWTLARLRRWPWEAVERQGAAMGRLERQTRQRLLKRQTGNEPAYRDFVRWLVEWRTDIEKMQPGEVEHLVEGLLAFPTGEAFWERVFEVWCLRETERSLRRCGCERLRDPLPLHRSGQGPIFALQRADERIAVWFQRQKPLGSPTWTYTHSGHALRGIPDVVVSSDRRPPLILDAKYREMRTPTRSQETYKMLGYARNFRRTFAEKAFMGMLLFVGDPVQRTVLEGPNQDRLVLASVSLRQRSFVTTNFDHALKTWLAS